MVKKYFVKQSVKEVEIENFIRSTFPMGDYSKTELQRTPLGLKLIIYTNKPGRIIGKGGKNINDMTEALKKKFKIENPQIDVKSIEHPDLDAKIVAKQIASALERGYNHKKIGNLTLKRILDGGAAGAEIVISGVLGGGKSGQGKFLGGYMKHCGQPAKDLVDYGFEEAYTKRGSIGIKVRIMKSFMDVAGNLHKGRPTKDALLIKFEKPKEEEKKKKKSTKKKTKKTEKLKSEKKEAPKKKEPVAVKPSEPEAPKEEKPVEKEEPKPVVTEEKKEEK